ncbi:hypothetical protein GCM10009720_08330 [Yaniella flava]|uniref:Uncharacterized protein n=1 Tax=Yaniella flava TaxID=287930 RepID=A0ABP5FN70_9MICC
MAIGCMAQHYVPDQVISTRGLQIRYGTKQVLDGIDLTINAHEVVAVLGPKWGRHEHNR